MAIACMEIGFKCHKMLTKLLPRQPYTFYLPCYNKIQCQYHIMLFFIIFMFSPHRGKFTTSVWIEKLYADKLHFMTDSISHKNAVLIKHVSGIPMTNTLSQCNKFLTRRLHGIMVCWHFYSRKYYIFLKYGKCCLSFML